MTRLFLKDRNTEKGFTIPEVIVAGVILIILCVGVMSAYVQAIKINRGNNLRMQALSVLQQEVEFYRSLKFVPGLGTFDDLDNHRPTEIRAGTHSLPNRESADGRVFMLSSTVTNISFNGLGTGEEHATLKEIRIQATPLVPESEGWLQELNAEITLQRVRSN